MLSFKEGVINGRPEFIYSTQLSKYEGEKKKSCLVSIRNGCEEEEDGGGERIMFTRLTRKRRKKDYSRR